MSETLVLDYSYARPDPKAIKAAGYSDVMRYLSPDPNKNLSAAERDALWAAGLGIGLVWEWTAQRAAQGLDAGKADALAAQAQADALGFPRSQPIFFAVDFDAPVAAVTAYFQGIQAVLHNPVGVYGSVRVVTGIIQLGLASVGWQSEAWSGTAISPSAGLYQRVKATVQNPIGGTDENVLIGSSVTFWGKDAPATPPKPPVVRPVRPNVAPGPHLGFPLPAGYYFGPADGGKFSVSGKYKRIFNGHYDYWWLQQFAIQLQRRGWNLSHYLPSGNDGVYGPEFKALIGAFQKDQGLPEDDDAGYQTWHAAFENPLR